MGNRRCFVRIFGLLLLPLLFALCSIPPSVAADVSLAWNPSASPNISGYKVYYGNDSRVYGAPIAVGNQTTYTLRGLAGNTWYFSVTAFDNDGNESDFSNEVSSSSGDTTPPVISGISIPVINNTSVVIAWNTNGSSSWQIEYGTTTGYGRTTSLDSAMAASYSQALRGLLPDTLYHYRVKSRDAAGNLMVSRDYTFTTTKALDATTPVINGVLSINTSDTGATVTWTTSEVSDSQIEYGTTIGYGGSTPLNGLMATSHSQELTGLTTGTLYHYRVKSRDAAGNLATSGDHTFTARKGPMISNVTVSEVTSKNATITWTTDRSSDSEVEYRITERASEKAILRTLVTEHSLTLNQLDGLTLYRFRVKSADEQGSLTVSSELAFTTTRYGGPALVWPRFSAAQNVLGADTMVGIGLANLDPEPAILTFTAKEDEGTLATAAQEVNNPATRQLSAQEQLPVLDWQLFGSWLSGVRSNGWVKLQSNTENTMGFFLIFDGDRSLMDGANFTDTKLTDFAFTEIQTDGYNKISIINDNSEDVTVSFDLVGADGSIRDSQSRVIKSEGALTSDLFTDLFTGIQPQATHYIRVKSGKGVQPFQVMRQKSGDIATLTGQDITRGGTALYSPQYVIGGSYRTSLSVINLDSKAGSVSFRFIREDGTQMGSTRMVEIPANGKLYIDDPAFFLPLDPGTTTAGYVEMVSDGIRLTGSTVFGDINQESFLTSLALISKLETSVLFSHVASSDIYFTSLAILNPNSIGATVTIELYSEGGTLIDTKKELIAAGQRRARSLTDYFNSMEGKSQTSGYIRLISDHPIASFALFGTHNLSVLSAIPAQTIRAMPEKGKIAPYVSSKFKRR